MAVSKQLADSVSFQFQSSLLHQKALINNLLSVSEATREFLLVCADALAVHGETPEVQNELFKSSDLTAAREDTGGIIITRAQLQFFCDEQCAADKSYLAKGGYSRAALSRRVSELKALNVLTERKYQAKEGKNRYTTFIISDITELVAKPQIRSVSDDIPSKRRSLAKVITEKRVLMDDESAIFLTDAADISVHFHQQIFNGILDTVMRLSHKDKRKTIDATYPIRGEPLLIQASCLDSTDSGIAILTDQRAMRPLIAYCRKEIAYRKAQLMAVHGDDFLESMIPNLFRIDIHDLCTLMGMQPVGENIDRAVGMMQRLADTNFRVDARKNQWFKDMFSHMPGFTNKTDIFNFRFLNSMDIALEESKQVELFGQGADKIKPRFYVFSLEPRIFYSMLLDDSKSLFISHPELSQERSGILQRFYNWARVWVSGRERSGVTKTWYSIQDIHLKLTPASRFDNFRKYFLRALEKKAIEGTTFEIGVSGTSLVYGFYVAYKKENGIELFNFWRDRNDLYVGDNSEHNKALRAALLDGVKSSLYIEQDIFNAEIID